MVLALLAEIEELYWRSIDRPKVAHWLAAYDLVRTYVEPHPASTWAQGLHALPWTGAPKELTDAVLPDEFPLSMFFETFQQEGSIGAAMRVDPEFGSSMPTRTVSLPQGAGRRRDGRGGPAGQAVVQRLVAAGADVVGVDANKERLDDVGHLARGRRAASPARSSTSWTRPATRAWADGTPAPRRRRRAPGRRLAGRHSRSPTTQRRTGRS